LILQFRQDYFSAQRLFMPRLIIDDLEIEVAPGTKVIAAAEQLGIMIPRFCYHPGLGSVGACRVCAVKFLQGPFKGVQMSCMVEARDGMVVSTTDEEAVEFRRQVIEWLMLNHPHDCPVCDEGGHCLLQDETVAGGHGLRRYPGRKRTYRDQVLGALVQHEMNRCIHCYRCRRFYQDFAGYRDLGAMAIANRTYFGRFADGPLESPFAGNLIDICPTGVYTDKPARFKGRRWDFERSPSLCIHCSLGCHTVASARYREVVRLEADYSQAVNGYFICDRGRFGFHYTNHPERPRQARIGGREAPWNEALQAAAQRLASIRRAAGAGATACIGSTRCSVETLAMLKRLSTEQGWCQPAAFSTGAQARKVRAAVSRLDECLAVSLGEVERADFILVLGADPVNEAPMLALALRQAQRNGASVVVIDPRPVFLPFPFEHLPLAPGALDLALSALMKAAVPRSAVEPLGAAAVDYWDALPDEIPGAEAFWNRLAAILPNLGKSQYPLIVCGTDVVRETTPAAAADHALLLRTWKGRAGLFYLLPGANAHGAAIFSGATRSLEQAVEAIENGSIKALVVVEHDPFHAFPDRERLLKALDQLDLLLGLDYLPAPLLQKAHIVLPTRTLFEIQASFSNQEGRLQSVAAVYSGGVPIAQWSAGKHPPREFASEIPGNTPKAAWQVLAELSAALNGDEKPLSYDELWTWISRSFPALSRLQPGAAQTDSARVTMNGGGVQPFLPNGPFQEDPGRAADGRLELLLVDWTFGTEELSRHSPHLQQAEKPPCLVMHSGDAAHLELASGDRIALDLPGGKLEVELTVAENMAPGVLVLPRHRMLTWNRVKGLPTFLSGQQIKKA
jgi:NADH-quinone oxidoreductase subunit G